MSYQKVECFLLVCDNCQEHYENYNGFSIFVDKNSAKDDALDDEWYADKEKHYCPECYTIKDDDDCVINNLITK